MKNYTSTYRTFKEFALFAFLTVILIMSGCKQSPEKILSKHYETSVPSTKKTIAKYAQTMTKSRGGSPTDTLTMVFDGKRISNTEFEELERLRVDTLMQGLKMFEGSKWEDAQNQFRKYVKRYPQPLDDYKLATFYLAKSSLNNEEYAAALKYYDEFTNIASADHEMMDMATWDHAICYLMVDSNKAKAMFDNIAGDNSSSYTDEAKAILAYL